MMYVRTHSINDNCNGLEWFELCRICSIRYNNCVCWCNCEQGKIPFHDHRI